MRFQRKRESIMAQEAWRLVAGAGSRSVTPSNTSENRDWTRSGVRLWALRVSFPAVFILQWVSLLEGAYFPKTAPLTRDQVFTCLSLGGHFSFKPPQWPKCHTRFCISHAIENKWRWIRILKEKKTNHTGLFIPACCTAFAGPAAFWCLQGISPPFLLPHQWWLQGLGDHLNLEEHLTDKLNWCGCFFPWCPSSSPGIL